MTDYGEIHNLLLAGLMKEVREDPDKDLAILGPVVVKDMEAQGGRVDVLRRVLGLYGISLWVRDDCKARTVYLTNKERFVGRGCTYTEEKEEDSGEVG